jgi:hypothetical protein
MSPHTNVGGDLFTVLSQLTRAGPGAANTRRLD